MISTTKNSDLVQEIKVWPPIYTHYVNIPNTLLSSKVFFAKHLARTIISPSNSFIIVFKRLQTKIPIKIWFQKNIFILDSSIIHVYDIEKETWINSNNKSGIPNICKTLNKFTNQNNPDRLTGNLQPSRQLSDK